MLPGSTGVSQGFAVAVAVLSVGGSVHTQSVLPAVYGLLYAACFALAMRGLSSPLQLVLMFAMVGLSFALHMVFLPAGSTAHTALPTRECLSFSHSLSHTHTHTHTYSLARSIDRFLVRSGRPLLLLQSDDRKERRIDGCYRPWRREGHEGSLRQLEFWWPRAGSADANDYFRHVHRSMRAWSFLASCLVIYKLALGARTRRARTTARWPTS